MAGGVQSASAVDAQTGLLTRRRDAYTHLQAAFGWSGEFDRATVRLGDRAHDREAEPEPSERAIQAPERLGQRAATSLGSITAPPLRTSTSRVPS